MTLVAYGPPKYCPKCGHKRPRSDFYARRGRNGVLYAAYLCKEHDKQRVMEAQRENRARTRQNDKRTRERKLSDPERLAQHRDYQREWFRGKHGLTPERYRPTHLKTPKATDRGGRAPVEPFARWLETLGESSADIGLRTGLDARKVRAYLSAESPTVPFDVVDGALLHAVTDVTIDDLYPNWFVEAA